MKRKMLCLLLSVVLVFGMVSGCGDGNTTKDSAGEVSAKSNGTSGAGDWGKGGTVKTAMGTAQVDPEKSLLSSVNPGRVQDDAEYTLMIYMIGSNLETEAACASQDIVEMANSGVDFSKVNVLVYAGGAQNWAIGLPSACNSLILLGNDSYEVVAQTKSRENMGDPQTFYDFLAYSFNNYPADQYGLICWDHGGGPVLGYGSDELFDNDGLSLAEYQLALEASPFGPNNKLAFVGYDACLMAGLEIADMWSDYADYMIASTETEMGTGWDYSFLSAFNTSTDALTISKACVDTFAASFDNFYQENYSEATELEMGLLYLAGSYPYATLSCVDLSQTDACMTKMDMLMNALAEDIDTVYPVLAQVRSGVKSYGGSFLSDYDLIDAAGFVDALPEPYNTILSGEDVQAMVVYGTTNTASPNSVSMYFPHFWEELYYTDQYQDYMEFAATDAYRGFLEKYTALRFNTGAEEAPAVDGNVAASTNPKGKSVVEVPASMTNTLASATYTLLYAPNDDDCYLPILTGAPLEVSEDGSLVVPDTTEVLGASNCDLPLTGRQIAKSGNTVSLAVGNLKLSGAEGSKPVSVRADMDTETGEVILRSIMEETTGFAPMEKSFALGEGWENLTMECVSKSPTYDSDGTLLPCSQWESGSRSWNFGIALDSSTPLLEAVSADALPGTLMIQAQLEDVYGNVMVTELLPAGIG